MSNDELARNANGDGFVQHPRFGDCMLDHLAPTLMQIESYGCELVVRDKVVKRIIDAHHAHVLGHA